MIDYTSIHHTEHELDLTTEIKMSKMKVSFKFGTPMCCTRKQYKVWKEANSGAARAFPHTGFCTDCTPEFQAKNIIKGTCENPGILFDIDEDGFVCGRFPSCADVTEADRLDSIFNKANRLAR